MHEVGFFAFDDHQLMYLIVTPNVEFGPRIGVRREESVQYCVVWVSGEGCVGWVYDSNSVLQINFVVLDGKYTFTQRRVIRNTRGHDTGAVYVYSSASYAVRNHRWTGRLLEKCAKRQERG